MELLRRTRLLLIAAALCAGLGLAACSGSDDDEGDSGAADRAQTGPAGEAGSDEAGKRSGEPGEGSGKSGGGTGKGSGRAGRGSGSGGGSGPALSGDREKAREASQTTAGVYEGFRQAVGSGISKPDVAVGETLESAAGNESLASVCDLMSRGARKQTVEYARRSAGLADVDWTCEKATGLLLRRAEQAGGVKRTLRAQVVGVNAEGDRATATIRFGGKGPLSTVPLVREDGEWKLAASPAGGGGGQ